MKRCLFLLILVFILFGLCGCGNSIKPLEVEQNLILDLVHEEYSNFDNVRILTQKPFRDNIIVVISYDVGNSRFIDCRFVKENNNKITLLGGGGGIAEHNLDNPIPLTVSSNGATSSDDEPYFITYGEIFENSVKQIKVEYSDGETITEEVSNNGYLIIREEKVVGIKKIEALNIDSEVIYSIP